MFQVPHARVYPACLEVPVFTFGHFDCPRQSSFVTPPTLEIQGLRGLGLVRMPPVLGVILKSTGKETDQLCLGVIHFT